MPSRDVRRFEFTLDNFKIPYHLGWGISSLLPTLLADANIDRFVFISDTNVRRIHGDLYIRSLAQIAPVVEIILDPGEGAKSFETLGKVCRDAIARGATRRSCVVAMGGGVVGNVAGTAAGLLYRGISLVHIPTTLLAATDSVISLKQAVNSPFGKNHLGLFHAPILVVADLMTFETLPEREMRSGIGEVVKTTLVAVPESYDEVVRLVRTGRRRTSEVLERIIDLSISAKLGIMAKDGKERRRALIFEYGHTIGHAIELADLKQRGVSALAHGECVALGTLAAAELSAMLLDSPKSLYDAHQRLVGEAELDKCLPRELSPESVMAVVNHDNKRGYINCADDEVAMVLLHDLGRPAGEDELPLNPVKLSHIKEAIAHVLVAAS